MKPIIRYVRAMSDVGSVPAVFALGAFVAADNFDVDPFVLGGYLISEHGRDWTDDVTKCSEKSACGPYQLVSMWPRHFGYQIEDRNHPIKAAEITAQLINYSIKSHRKCSSTHDWRAHLKAGTGGRSTVSGPVRRWIRFEEELRKYGHKRHN